MKKIRKSFKLIMILMIIPIMVYAAPVAPPSGGAPGGSSQSSTPTYSGATTLSSNTTESSKTYASTTGGQNAILVSGGERTLNSCTVDKTGDSSGDDADFYGTNAAILVYNGATLNIEGGTFTTNGSHANAIFAYGKGIVNISNATINTISNNSGGVMVTGGGTLTANSCTVKTRGNSSAAIRSDRGGGTLIVNKGTYETSGTGSPVIYSTANITVNNAELTSTASEGVVVEGAYSVSLNNVTLTDTNNTLNGNSETYKNIFLYQSMSGDAESGTASFTAKDAKITTNKGDTIFVTNTTATISLENNTIKNSDGDFIRIQSGKWGTSGSNGGAVTLNMVNQKVSGNIIVDIISTLNLSMTSKSEFIGTINADNTAKTLSIKLSSDSVISLTGNSYITSLDNEVSDNSNIYLNGYKLYVNNKEISANDSYYDGGTSEAKVTTTEDNKNYTVVYVLAAVAVVLSLGIILVIKKKSVDK